MKTINITLLLATSALVACGQDPTLPVAQKWANAISNFDLVPLYPVQEDAQPGDVFLVGLDGQTGTNSAVGWRVRGGQIAKPKLQALLNANYADRLTPVDRTGKPIESEADSFVDGGPGRPPIRRRAMALPTIGIIRVSAADLAGGGAAGGFNVSGGISARNAAEVDVGIHDVSELHIGGGLLLATCWRPNWT